MEPNPAVLMFIAQRHVEQRVLQRLADEGFDDLTLAQARVAQRLAPDGIRLTELAAQAQVTKQTASVLVDQLERAGYVDRVPDPTDARARLIRIAARGRQAIEVGAAVETEVHAEWEAHLGPERWATLCDALTSLREIADPYQ